MPRPDPHSDPSARIWLYMGLVGLVLVVMAAMAATGMLGEPGASTPRRCVLVVDCGALPDAER